MPVKKYSYELVCAVYDFLDDNPLSNYKDIEDFVLRDFRQEVKGNSLVKQLSRWGCIQLEPARENGRIVGTRKVCVRRPSK